MAQLAVNLFGGFRATVNTGTSCALPTKAAALLAYLALNLGRTYSRAALAGLLWGDREDAQARKSLRQTLYALRKALPEVGPVLLDREGDGLGLDPAMVEADVPRFERLVGDAMPETLERAVGLYRGDLLQGFTVAEPAFEEWLAAERERLRALAVEALTKLLDHHVKTGDTKHGIQAAIRLLALDPLQEAVHRTLMRLYRGQGRRANALRQYQTCVDVLRRELRTEPEAETKQLYRELLQERLAPARTATEPLATTLASGDRLNLPAREGPLVGRTLELDRLRMLSRRAAQGSGQVAVVLGEAGIGKSRLLTEVATEAMEAGSAILLGRAFESEQFLAFGPWVTAIRQSGVLEEPGGLDALAPAWRSELARLFPELDAPAVSGSPPEGHLRLFEAVERLLAALAGPRPIVLLLEDLHWADEMSVRLLSYIGRRIHAQKLLVVASSREEELGTAGPLRTAIDELTREGRGQELRLSSLSRESTTELVRSLARSRERLSSSLEERIWRASEGNAFMAVEIVRAIEQGSDTPSTAPLPRPERVRALIAGRLDRLSPSAQTVAAVAAVIGREFEFALLQRASGLPSREAAEAVEELVRRRVLQGVGERFDFTHEQIRQVAYERLLAPTRRVHHLEVFEALETSPPADEHVEQLAHHAARAGLPDKAVQYLRAAGLKAAARSALAETRAWLEEALTILEALPESISSLEQGFEIRLELRPVLLQLGEVRRTLVHLHAAEALADRLGDDVRRGRACGHRTTVHTLLGDLDDAVQTGRRALDISRASGDRSVRILATTHLEQAHHFRGEYGEVIALATDNLASTPADRVHEHFGLGAPPSVFDRLWLVWAYAEVGRFAEADAYEAEALALVERTPQRAFTISVAHLATCVHRLLKGEWPQARVSAERFLAVARSGDIALLLPTALASSAWALAQLGEDGEAVRRLDESVQLLDRHAANGILGWRGWDYQALGRASLLLDRPDEARRVGHRALDCSPHHPGFAAHAERLLGDVATHPDRLDAERGEAHYRRAISLAEQRGMRPLVAHCHLGLGKLYRRTGKREQAREHLPTATTMYREMGMTYWLEQADAELRRV